jgi:hypothetical protein
LSKAQWIVLVSLVVVLSAGPAFAKPNFTGEWKMVPGKSDFGPMPPPTSIVQKITHEDPDLKVVSTSTSDRGEFTMTSTYTTDGKECTNKTRMGESKSTLKWDGDTLVIDTKADFQGNAVTILNKWTLSEDGKTLTVNGHFSGPMGEMDTRTVFEKQ